MIGTEFMIFDFHTHTFFSDGSNSPIELIRFADSYGYCCIAITDHASYSNIDQIINGAIRDCRLAERYWDIIAIPGVELTNIPAKSIDEMAGYAREKGAKIVVVHGESIVEPVEPGTNLAAAGSRFIDILAHPGLITEDVAKKAAANDIFLELTHRAGHCLSNGHTVKTGRLAGAKFLINSDAHSHNDLYRTGMQKRIALAAGLDSTEVEMIFQKNNKSLLKKLGYTLASEGNRPGNENIED